MIRAWTGTGQSSAELLGVSAAVVAEQLAGHLMREIMLRGSGGGPLAPLADQLNHDLTHLQGQRLVGMLARPAAEIRDGLAQAGSAMAVASKPVRLQPQPAFLAGREELLEDLHSRLTRDDGAGLRVVALCALGGAGRPARTLTARADVALWTGHGGDPAGARDQYAALLPVIERVLGTEHPDALTARAKLADWTGEAGDPAAARDQYAALLPVRERVSGAFERRSWRSPAGAGGEPELCAIRSVFTQPDDWCNGK